MKRKLTPCGRGGHRESSFDREGGKAGLYEYVKRKELNSQTLASKTTSSQKALKTLVNARLSLKPSVPAKAGTPSSLSEGNLPSIARTTKNVIASKQARPDGGLSTAITSPTKILVGEVGKGNPKVIRAAISSLSPLAGERWERGGSSCPHPSQIVIPTPIHR